MECLEKVLESATSRAWVTVRPENAPGQTGAAGT
jgi:hypothetical protein